VDPIGDPPFPVSHGLGFAGVARLLDPYLAEGQGAVRAELMLIRLPRGRAMVNVQRSVLPRRESGSPALERTAVMSEV